MARAEDYRRFAAECLAIAQRAANANDRARLLELAHAFNELATRFASEDAQGDRSPGEE
jgi:hypothetical protein